MRSGTSPVVKLLPATLNRAQAEAFFHEVAPILRSERAEVVFDFSEVRQLDGAGVEMLLRCMAEVMKGNGDLKLSAIPPVSTIILELTGVDCLFEIFENTADAVQSFTQFPAQAFQQTGMSW
ncbi:MAG TPA: STAS domain-containing protein [Terriglobales bacterium]|nr:STAS domain-containing protein [Terriglobales bacterium]